MRSMECPKCSRTYSPITSHNRCAVCRDSQGHLIETFPSDRLPIFNADKRRALKQVWDEHERRYERHVERRKKMGYPDPDEVGRMQGRQLANQLRELEQAFGS